MHLRTTPNPKLRTCGISPAWLLSPGRKRCLQGFAGPWREGGTAALKVPGVGVLLSLLGPQGPFRVRIAPPPELQELRTLRTPPASLLGGQEGHEAQPQAHSLLPLCLSHPPWRGGPFHPPALPPPLVLPGLSQHAGARLLSPLSEQSPPRSLVPRVLCPTALLLGLCPSPGSAQPLASERLLQATCRHLWCLPQPSLARHTCRACLEALHARL